MSEHFFPRRRCEAVNGILRRALARRGLSGHLPRQVPPRLWVDTVGAELAARAQPTVLSRGTLHVLVQDHRWRDQLDAARAIVIERLNRALGPSAVRELQFGLAHEGALELSRPAAAHAPGSMGVHVPGASALPEGLRQAVVQAACAARRRARA